jgi:hypothetical protein
MALAKEAGIKHSGIKTISTGNGGVTASFGPGRIKIGSRLPALEVPAIGFHELESNLCIIGIQFLLQNFQVQSHFPERIELIHEGDSE